MVGVGWCWWALAGAAAAFKEAGSKRAAEPDIEDESRQDGLLIDTAQDEE